jgi:DNA (cytosine-5)-methyltransferase 1
MKFLDLFSGIGGFRLGLERAGHTCVGHVEIDKFAQQSYNAIHKPREDEFFHADITTIGDDELQDLKQRGIDIITGGFPCQSFSIAGHRKGFEDTRGTLFFDIAKLAKEIQPKYLFLENVKGLLNHDKGDTFEVILRTLDEIGYDAEWQVLNSKHFGVPQNRERVFIIGHLRGSGGGKVFPFGRKGESTTTEPGKKTKEIKVVGRIGNGIHDSNRVIDPTGIAQTMQARDYKDPIKVMVKEETKQGINQIGNIIDTDSFGGNPQRGRVYGTDGISPSLNTVGGGGLEPKVAIPVLTPDRAEKRQNGRRFKENGEPMFTITTQDRHGVMVKEATKQGYAVAEPGDSINFEQPNSKTRRGRVGKGVANTITTSCNQAVIDQQYVDGIPDKHSFAKKKAQAILDKTGSLPERFNPYNTQSIDEVSPTLTANCDRSTSSSTVLMKQPNFRIRKLTPKECWRLQGFPDWAFERAKADGISDSQLYKQAGNSVTVNVVYEIAKRLK